MGTVSGQFGEQFVSQVSPNLSPKCPRVWLESLAQARCSSLRCSSLRSAGAIPRSSPDGGIHSPRHCHYYVLGVALNVSGSLSKSFSRSLCFGSRSQGTRGGSKGIKGTRGGSRGHKGSQGAQRLHLHGRGMCEWRRRKWLRRNPFAVCMARPVVRQRLTRMVRTLQRARRRCLWLKRRRGAAAQVAFTSILGSDVAVMVVEAMQ